MEDSKHCSMCREEGKTTLASNWCVECQACFCDECLKLHNKVPILRTHEVTKLSSSNAHSLKRKSKCKEHNEEIELFCKSCEKPLCIVYCRNSHQKCKDVITIRAVMPEVKCELLKRQEQFVTKTAKSRSDIAKLGDMMDTFLTKSASVKTDVTKTIHDAVDRLHKKDDELQEKLKVQTDQHAEKLRSMMRTKQTETQMYQQQSQSIQQALELEDEAQLFEMYLSSRSGPEADITETGTDDAEAPDISFTHDLDILKDHIARMDVNIEKMDFRRVNGNIDLTAKLVLNEVINAKVDGSDKCALRDAVVMGSSDMKTTVFADYDTKRLKSCYQRGGRTCASVLQLTGQPLCITIISESRIAVSVPRSQSIIIVAVTPDLRLLSTIQTRKKYRGLASLDKSTLVVSSDAPSSVDLIDMKGNTLRTFSRIPSMGKSFSCPCYVQITREGNILVSDWGLRSVICLTVFGKVVFTYTSKEDKILTSPCGITCTNSGEILVVDWGTHRLLLLNDSGEYVRDVLTQGDGLKYPFGVCVDGDVLCVTVRDEGLYKYRY